MKTKLALTLLILAGIIAPLRTAAQVTLDQSQLVFGSTAFIQGTTSVAQTFTPSFTGDFAQLDLYLVRDAYFETYPLEIAITDTLDGAPKTILGTTSFNFVQTGSRDWYSIDFTGQNIQLNVNKLYAFVLSNPGSFYGITDGGSVYDSYPGGMALAQSESGMAWSPYSRAPDLMFQTWMVPVPEPSSLAIVVVGCCAFVGRRFCARKN